MVDETLFNPDDLENMDPDLVESQPEVDPTLAFRQQQCKVQRCSDPADPNRCQASDAVGQCKNKAVPGGQVCIYHGGGAILKSEQTKAIRNLRLSRWRADVGHFSASKEITSLRDEIGVLRLLLSEKIERCTDLDDLLTMSAPISELIMKIEKIVKSCHQLETKMGFLLDKTTVLSFAAEVTQIVAEEVQDPDVVERVSERLIASLSRVTSDEDQES